MEAESLRFFVSRRRLEGGERFYLHLGFFPTLAESEHWRDIFRSTYPNAFVSQLGATSSAHAPDPAVLSETETLRVLEVRLPRRDDSLHEHAQTGSHGVTPEARLQTLQEESRSATTASARSDAPPVRTAAITRAGQTTGNSADLADALRNLAANSNEFEHTDLSSTTGVRHLRIEFARKSKRPARSSDTRRRT